MGCPACKAPLADGARFCQDCGAPAPAAARAEPSDPLREVLKLALGRQYDVTRLLGKGGMGAVYLATEAALEREVAIKVLPPDRGATQESRDRFRREARTAAKLSHPNIVPLHTFGDVDGTLYFVMGYVKGESLAARVKREGRLSIEESRRILIELCEALDYAHKLGIVHRDIKPDNVLIEEETGRAMLMDFGVAKALGAGQTMTEVGSVLGTPHYMSPEQAQGKANIDHRSDLYSLGVMGYAMLAGRRPFEGPTAGDVMAQHITKEAPPLHTLAPGLPVEVATALTRCLAKDRDKRWPDALALRRAITASADDEGPPQLDGLGTFFMVPTIGAFALLCCAAWWLGGGDVSEPFRVLPLIVATGGLVSFLLLPWRWLHLRRLGFTSATIVREIFKPLQRWPGWYPSRFRQPGDVWRLLPPEIRHFRIAIGWMFLAIALSIPNGVFGLAADSHMRRTGRPAYEGLTRNTVLGTALSLTLLPIFAALLLGVRFERFRRKRGIDPYLGSRLMEMPTFKRSFWGKPEIAALLMPETGGGAQGTLRVSPAALVEQMAVLVAAAPEPLRSLALKAQGCASALGQDVGALDRQIARLERAFDPLELKRIDEKLAALGLDDVDRELREMAEKQGEALRAVGVRLDHSRSARLAQLELLRSVLAETRALRPTSEEASGVESSIDRLEGLLARIDNRPRLPGENVATQLSDAPTLER